MANKVNLFKGVHELKIGKTFTKGYKDEAYHTIRYDFKPASVDSQNVGSLEVIDKEITLNVPLTGGAGSASQAVFKGNKTLASKDCFLIIDHATGEIVLERISQNIRVKKTRIEGSNRSRALPKGRVPQDLPANNNKPSPSQNHSSSSPHVARPSPPRRSPNRGSSNAKSHAATLDAGSMPMLNFEEEQKTGSIMSDSSSDSDSNSSSSSCDSDSDSDTEMQTNQQNPIQSQSQNYNAANGHVAAPRNGTPKSHKSLSVLSDLELSEEED